MRNDSLCLDCGQRPVRLVRGLCKPCYAYRAYRGMALPPKTIFSFEEYLAMIVPDENGCWPWPGHVDDGYGSTGRPGGQRSRRAHVRSYEHHVGPVPDGYEVGHMCHDRDPTCLDPKKCRHRRCINPAHLKPQTRSENSKSKPKRTHCRRGHEYSDENTRLTVDGRRQCRACFRVTHHQRRAKQCGTAN